MGASPAASRLAGAGTGHRPVALTMGDPAGIGLDITLAAWNARTRHCLPTFVLYGDPDAIEARAKLLGLDVEIELLHEVDAQSIGSAARLPVVPVRLKVPAAPGTPSSVNAPAVIEAIERAVGDVVAGNCSAVTTNPIAKSVLYEAGFRHPGHTEFLAELACRHFPGRDFTSVMMLASDDLCVVPLTVHIPLLQVSRAISRDLILETVRITVRDLKHRFGIVSPRIAVSGLNPHAGEGGALGREEIEVIAPAIAALRSEGIEISGPHAADTMFHAAARREYDAAICMYHDQALIPLKTLAFDDGVNVTLGLPFIRTSPDHGTAFGIAGTGNARETSLVAAIKLAARLGAQAPSPDVPG